MGKVTDHAAVIREGIGAPHAAQSNRKARAHSALAALEQERENWKAAYIEMREWRADCLGRAEAAEAALAEANERGDTWRDHFDNVDAQLAEAKRKMDACPVCSQNVPGPSWRDA